MTNQHLSHSTTISFNLIDGDTKQSKSNKIWKLDSQKLFEASVVVSHFSETRYTKHFPRKQIEVNFM